MTVNPVLRKELLLLFRVRHQKPVRYAVAIIFVVIVVMVYWSGIKIMTGWGGVGPNYAFGMIMYLQFQFILVVSPVAAANAITREREQQTWEMLVSTRLSASEIVLGKLAARFSPIALMLLAFLPFSLLMLSMSYMGGGAKYKIIEAPTFFACYLFLVVCAFLYTVSGLWFSWVMKRTIYAILTSYAFVIGFLCIGTLLICIMVSSLSAIQFYTFPLIWLNPVRIMIALGMPGNPEDTVDLLGGLACYVLIALAMLGLMIRGLRKRRLGNM